MQQARLAEARVLRSAVAGPVCSAAVERAITLALVIAGGTGGLAHRFRAAIIGTHGAGAIMQAAARILPSALCCCTAVVSPGEGALGIAGGACGCAPSGR